MFNYKKNLLSLAAATALSVTTAYAGYIPLTNASTNDEAWVLFGVTGLKSTGAGAGTSAGTFSISDNTANTLKDTVQDELFVEGLFTNTGKALAKVKVLSPYAQVEVRVDTTDAVFSETEPIRTMYVTFTEGGSPSFAFTYRSSLEGETMQYSSNSDGSAARSLTISSQNTYNNPAYGEVIEEVPGVNGSELDSLSEVVDYDFSDNPSDSVYFDESTDRTLAGVGQYLRVYSYNAATEQWDLYDSRNTAEANDFDSLKKGKAYWAKMDDNGAPTVGGLVLGSSSISVDDYISAGITDGWNLMAFDQENPDIRKSSTGLILSTNGSGNITLYDSSANHSVTIAINNTSLTTLNSSAKLINATIRQAILNGEMPETFDLKAFTLSATELVLLANERFFVQDTGTAIGAVTTLTGANPYSVDINDIVNTDDSAAIADLSNGSAVFNSAVMSKYGEYAMLIEPLVGDADSAAPWDTTASIAANAARVHLQSAATDSTSVGAISINNSAASLTALTATATALGNGITGVDIGGYKSYAYSFDSDYDNTADLILLASPKPFYIRDHTFTRVFDYTDDTTTSGDITTSGTGSDGTYPTVAGAQNTAALALALDGASIGIHATEDTTGNSIIITTSTDNANEFTVTENTSSFVDVDQLKDTTLNDNAAKGAIKGVYSIEAFTSATPTNTVTNTLTAWPTDGTDTIDIALKNTLGGTDDVLNVLIDDLSSNAAPANDAEANIMADEILSYIKDALSVAGIFADITRSSDSFMTNNTFPVYTIVSKDIAEVSFTFTGGTGIEGGTTLASSGDLTTVIPDLADDLKYNAIYSPNYVVDGPLYTMKESGFTLEAMVTGTTDISDGSVNWDSVDLTRTPSAWLDSQDYNLFSINENLGYWAYLQTDTGTNTLAVSTAQLKPLVYTYRFNRVNSVTTEATNYNSVSSNIALTIDGLDTDVRAIPVVSVTIAGSEVELSNVAGTTSYTGKVSSYEIENMIAGYNYEVLANIADGLGYNLKSLDVGLTIDLLKPNTPAVDFGDGTAVAITSTSTDTAGFYIFNGQIPEESTASASNLITRLDVTEAAAYGLCAQTTKLAWYKPAYELNVIAVDGTGILGGGNASNTKSVDYVPMLKSSIRLEDTANSDILETFDGSIYGSDCVETGTVGESNTYGMSITSITDLETVRLAYEPISITGTATPISLFVHNSTQTSSVIGKIEYNPAYVGKTVYVELEGRVYSLILPSEEEITTNDNTTAPLYGAVGVGASTSNPLDLNDGSVDWDATTGMQTVGSTGYAEYQEGQSLNSSL